MDFVNAANLILIELSYIINIYSEKTYIKGHVINRDKVHKQIKKSSKWKPIDVRIKYSDELEYIIKTIKEKLPYVDLTFMNNNLEDLVIAEKNKLNKYNKRSVYTTMGSYGDIENTIYLRKNNGAKSLSHEFLHMCSAFNQGKIQYCGFFQRHPNNFNIGKGLNEGFTSYLDKKLFGGKDTYYYIQPYIQALIKIVGEEELTKYYFRADLNGLINHLSQYIKDSYVYRFIENIDKLLNIISNASTVTKKNDKHQATIDRIMEENERILLNIYTNKIKMKFSELGMKDGDEVDVSNEYMDFVNSFVSNMDIYNLKLDFVNIKVLEDELSKHFQVNNFEFEEVVEEDVKHKM